MKTEWYAKPTAGHETHGQSAVYDASTGKDIAIVYDGQAHAALIAAAPDLLAAAKAALACLCMDSDSEEDYAPEIKRLKAAISKASNA